MAEAVDILERQVKDLERKRDDLERDNQKQRDELREARNAAKALEAERDEFKGKLPPDGSVILSRADSERWTAYQALGKLDDVSAKVKGYGDLEAKEKRREREDGIKALGYKPSVFEVIAQGSSYRSEGEGDDRRVYLTVDDKEVELAERATALGLDDLLGVMGAEVKASEPKAPTPTGAGTRTPAKRTPLDENAEYETKKSSPAYRG